MQEALVTKKIKIRRKEFGYKDWWDRSCTRKKREVKRSYKKWRIGNEGITKKKEIGEKEEKILRNLKRESEIWRFINKKRRKRENERNRIKKKQ